MSYIYDALKRAQRENEGAVVPPGSAARVGVFFARRSRWWPWALAGVLAVNVVVLAAVVVRDRPAPPEAPAVSVAPPPPVTGGTTVREPVAVVAEAPAPQPVVVETTDPPALTAAPPAPLPARAAAPRVVPPSRQVHAPTPRAVANPEVALAPPPPARPVVEPPARAPQVAPPDAAPPSPPVPEPKVTLQVLVYSDTPSQRMVFIDGRRYVEGDAFDTETVLERIMADGIVMTRRGQRFVINDRRR